MTRNIAFAAPVLACLLASGCGALPGEDSDSLEDGDLLGEAEQPLPSERSNGTASIVYAANQYYSNPDMAVNQWAEASFNWTGCNGVMIGPNIDGSRAIVVPDGRTTGSPNWAVRVAPPATAGYPVRNGQLALLGGRPYRICYDAKRQSGGSWAQAELRLVSGGAVAATSQNYLTTTWTTYCTGTFTPGSDDNGLQIRLMGGDASFLVDNIAISEM